MPIVSNGLGQLDAEIKSAVGKLGPEAVHVAYRLREDSTGDPSIFFRIVLADSVVREDTLTEIANSIATTLIDEVRAIENWGPRPYFNYRRESEHQTAKILTGFRWPITTIC